MALSSTLKKLLLLSTLTLLGCRPGERTPPADAPPLVRLHRIQKSGIDLTILVFDTRLNYLEILDKPAGPESAPRTAKTAAEQAGALAALNGGFFTPEGQPLGFLRTHGEDLGGLHPGPLGEGLVLDTPPTLLRRENFRKVSQQARHILQAGPFLILDSQACAGLRGREPRDRAFLLSDGKHLFALAHSSACSLESLAQALAQQPIPEFHIERALNLDGGTSADLWISREIPGGPLERSSFFRKPVRNYLLLKSPNPAS